MNGGTTDDELKQKFMERQKFKRIEKQTEGEIDEFGVSTIDSMTDIEEIDPLTLLGNKKTAKHKAGDNSSSDDDAALSIKNLMKRPVVIQKAKKVNDKMKFLKLLGKRNKRPGNMVIVGELAFKRQEIASDQKKKMESGEKEETVKKPLPIADYDSGSEDVESQGKSSSSSIPVNE